jgi:polysaccharide deacetylase family protein (PEP-CTERM system associated)
VADDPRLLHRAWSAPEAVHLLSFDVEEYFQVESASGGVDRRRWDSLPRRLPHSVDTILELLDRHGARATFFVLGWVARHEPEVVRRIAGAGHEIASHGTNHHMIGDLGPAAFRDDLLESRKRLEDIAGCPVRGYRAPTFSITHTTAWALDVLAECGFTYDSSVFPVRHDRYGVVDAPTCVHWAQGPGGGRILELPMLTFRLLRFNMPAAGGGYLRLMPIRMVGKALRSAALRGDPSIVYLHPWELDPGQPALAMPPLRRFRHRVGLGKTRWKLMWLLKRFAFTGVADRLDDLTNKADAVWRYGDNGRCRMTERYMQS